MKKLLLILTLLSLSIIVVARTCLPEGIIFETQAQVDSFQEDYPGCTIIEGFLAISDSDIKNLNGLNVITAIGGNLVIEFNDSLTNLDGLDGVTSVGGDLDVILNPLLLNLIGLSSLTSISGNLHISINASLTSLSGLDNIESGTIEDILIYNNALLSFCNVLSICESLASPNGAISIIDNAGSCNSLIELANDCNVTVSCLPYGDYYFLTQEDIDNFQTYYPDCTELQGSVLISGNNITNLNGLSVITSVSGSLTVRECNSLPTLAGLENVNSVGNYLIISTNEILSNLSGFDNLDSVGFSLWIEGNSTMTSLAGLENLVYVGDGIDIAGNTALESLAALSNVTSIRYELQIASNSALTNLSGLDNIDGGTISSLYISNNTSLTTCEVQSVCDYLANPNGFYSIYNNATGCNSVEEVETACTIGFKENRSRESQINIYPNPASDLITIEITGSDQNTLIFLDLNGQKLDYFEISEPRSVLDISHFPNGVFFGKMTNSYEVRMFKVIKY